MVDVVRSRTARGLKVAGLAVLVTLVSAGCSAGDVLGFGWPDGVTPQADRMRDLWVWSLLAALIVGVIVWGLIAWSVVFHRKRSDELPRQTQYNLPLEIVYTVIPFLIVAVLFYFTATAQNFVNAKVDNPDVRVKVVGFQWNWEFQYLEPEADADGRFVPMQDAEGTPVATVGTSSVVPLLVVPTERTVEYRIESTDVLHSFFIPEFLFKRDVFPNPENNATDNVFQTQIERTGAFVGRCAELCGTYHAMMNFEVRALPGDVFDQYLELLADRNPDTGQIYTAGEALQELQDQGECDAELCSPLASTTTPFETDRTDRDASGSGNN